MGTKRPKRGWPESTRSPPTRVDRGGSGLWSLLMNPIGVGGQRGVDRTALAVVTGARGDAYCLYSSNPGHVERTSRVAKTNAASVFVCFGEDLPKRSELNSHAYLVQYRPIVVLLEKLVGFGWRS